MKNNKIGRLSFREWLTCYAGSLGFGGITWWATGNPWIGGGVLVAFTAAYVFYLAGRSGAATPQHEPQGKLTRQQRRLNERSKNNK